MLLAVDIGNTNIKFGVYDGESLLAKLSVQTIRDISAAGLAKVIGSRVTHDISAAIVSSVVPEVDAAMREFINSTFNIAPVFVANDSDLGLTIKYEPLADASSGDWAASTKASAIFCAVCAICHGRAPSSARAAPTASAVGSGGSHATRRRYSGIPTKDSTAITSGMPGPMAWTTSMAKSRPGKAWKISTTRRIRASTSPPD